MIHQIQDNILCIKTILTMYFNEIHKYKVSSRKSMKCHIETSESSLNEKVTTSRVTGSLDNETSKPKKVRDRSHKEVIFFPVSF